MHYLLTDATQIFSGEIPYSDVQNEVEVLLKYVVPRVLPKRPSGVEDRHWDILMLCWSAEPQARPSAKALTALFVA